MYLLMSVKPMPNFDNNMSKLSKIVDFDLMTACRVDCHFADIELQEDKNINQT